MKKVLLSLFILSIVVGCTREDVKLNDESDQEARSFLISDPKITGQGIKNKNNDVLSWTNDKLFLNGREVQTGSNIDYSRIGDIIEENLRPAFDAPSPGEIYKAITNDLVYIVVTNALMSQAQTDANLTEIYRRFTSITNKINLLQNKSEEFVVANDKYPIIDFDLNFKIPNMYFTTNSFGEYEPHALDDTFIEIYDYNNFELKAITNDVEVYHASLTNRVNRSLQVYTKFPRDLGMLGDWDIYTKSRIFSNEEIPLYVRLLIDVDNIRSNEWCKLNNENLHWYINRLPRINELDNWFEVKPVLWNTLNIINE